MSRHWGGGLSAPVQPCKALILGFGQNPSQVSHCAQPLPGVTTGSPEDFRDVDAVNYLNKGGKSSLPRRKTTQRRSGEGRPGPEACRVCGAA